MLATEHIVRLQQLKYYFASYTRITDRTPELLSHMDSLERITLDGCERRLSDTGVGAPEVTAPSSEGIPRVSRTSDYLADQSRANASRRRYCALRRLIRRL